MRFRVVPYDPRWPQQFRTVRDDLAAVLDGVLVRSIEHVGSTSVPGLAAKPQIDVDIVVPRDELATAIAALESGGYTYLGELGIPDRHAFRAPDGEPPRNVYVVVDGCLALRNHLAVRDLLRRDAQLRDEYSRLKLELAGREYADGNEYVADKSPVLQRILAAAGFGTDELAAIDALNRLD